MPADHSLLFDENLGDLDRDLVNSLIALESAENQADETRLPGGSIVFTGAAWFIVGMLLWVAAALYL
ncbi:hypothetical protein [Pseudomonas sp. dw_358]|uniref:hypothetical protein n=1 Tax=Pseudomonas sp. dw_358 TaxID=2720083 RepID=UPI001BD479AD|nr:hypothetical protein [Pseudomonas sp. dw_358]